MTDTTRLRCTLPIEPLYPWSPRDEMEAKLGAFYIAWASWVESETSPIEIAKARATVLRLLLGSAPE